MANHERPARATPSSFGRSIGEGDARPDTWERLTPADASNVVLDSPYQVNAFLLAGVLGPGGFVRADGSADLAVLRAAVAARLTEDPALRRFRQRVGTRARKLVWEPAAPDLEHHVRQVDPVSGSTGLAELAARLMTTPLPKDRPLWEFLVVPGAAALGPGMVLRVHHAMADGVAGVRLVERLFGLRPEPILRAAPPPPQRRRPNLRTVVRSLDRISAMFRATIAPTVLLGPIGSQRGVALAAVDLAVLAGSARAAGGTVNDALLSAVAGAVRAALTAAGEPVPDVLPASVPVALSDRGGSGNAVGVMLVRLPTGDPDPVARLIRIGQLTRAAKADARRQGTYELTRTRWTTRLFAWLARRQRFIALFVTNVRGPAERLNVAGAPLRHAWPVAPIYGNVRLGIAAFSYAGQLYCAAHLDAGALNAKVFEQSLRTELAAITRSAPEA